MRSGTQKATRSRDMSTSTLDQESGKTALWIQETPSYR